jgi:hypothetical protein
MKITIFSSNQPRHLSLVRKFAEFSEKVYFVNEVSTVFPGKVQDFFHKSDVMQDYFRSVMKSEKKMFGNINFLPSNVETLSIKSGDINWLCTDQLESALSSDLYVVFGATYIKGWLADYLIENKAINIHMGLSPYYRGSSCNFWAMYDNNPSYVGATIHMLDKGLDSGDILFHCIPKLYEYDNLFDFTMRSVAAAHDGLVSAVKNESIYSIKMYKQDNSLEIRYSQKNEFTDDIAKEFMSRKFKLNREKFKYPKLISLNT